MATELLREDRNRMQELAESLDYTQLPPYKNDVDWRSLAIYWMSVAILHIIQWILRRDRL